MREENAGKDISLAIVCQGVDRMGGRLGLESILEVGSRFWVEVLEIKATGARPGIWFRPLLTTESVPDHWVLPESRFNIPREFGFYLDPSLPDVLDRISQDVARFKEWGYELIKHDYTTFDLLGRWRMHMDAAVTNLNWRFADRSLTTVQVIRNLYTRIHEAADDMVIIVLPPKTGEPKKVSYGIRRHRTLF
jgi:hypothetical protein